MSIAFLLFSSSIIMPIALLIFHFYFDSCFICSIVPIYNGTIATATSTVGVKFTRTQLATLRLCNLLLINIVL